ncbi:MAG: hypothetical protein QME52_09295 [Bacteroidota bacterium]|nr:hypothetical protein [Bacteroidota bacterium]
MKKNNVHLFGLICLLLICGCGPSDPDSSGTGRDVPEPNWKIRWSYEAGEALDWGGGPTRWDHPFSSQAGYVINLQRLTPTQVPFSSDLRWNYLWEDATKFYRQWMINSGYDTIWLAGSIKDTISFLCGVARPQNTPPYTYGVSLEKGILQLSYNVALSFVFKSAIYNDFTLNQSNILDYIITHELGHSRGLNYNDHDVHAGGNFSTCVMRYPSNHTLLIPPFWFCGRHEKILRECLYPRILNVYNHTHSCAQFP